MQTDGNLVLYSTQSGTSRPIWASQTPGQTNASAVIYGCNLSVGTWQSHTNGAQYANSIDADGTQLVLDSDGNVQVLCQTSGDGSFTTHGGWQSGSNGRTTRCCCKRAAVDPDPGLRQHRHLTRRHYQLIMLSNGNLVIYYKPGTPQALQLWSSGTSGNPGAVAVMQTDGNLVVYDNGTALWAAGSVRPTRPCRSATMATSSSGDRTAVALTPPGHPTAATSWDRN